MKHLILIILLFFFATSCKKETTVVIQAQDYISGDGSAYAGQEYAVAETWTPFQETKSEIVATGFLDANGKASFNLKMKNSRRYILGASKPDNICFGGLVQHYLDHEESNTVNFDYARCAHLKFVLNNVNCFDSSDAIKYSRTWVTGNENQGENTYYGCQYYEGNYFELPAGNYRYDWEVTRNGTTTFYSENFTLVDGDSLVFELDY
jgi:hypothetical protein